MQAGGPFCLAAQLAKTINLEYMKKFVYAASLILLSILPVATKAETIFGFMDGKYYDQNQALKYFCFLDKSCFDISGKQVSIEAITGQPQPTTPAQPTINQQPQLGQLENQNKDSGIDYSKFPRCVDLPNRGSYGSESSLYECWYYEDVAFSDAFIQRPFQAQFVATTLSGKATKKLTNGSQVLYLDGNNIQVK